MNIKCGIVGLPNVGKSTLFNLLTYSEVKTANFPFCTVVPNLGMMTVVDTRLIKLANVLPGRIAIPIKIELVDIAGLVEGSSIGKGLGNRFLSYVRNLKVIIHVVRCFLNNDVPHVSTKLDANNDINIVNHELIISDIITCENMMDSSKIYNKKQLLVIDKCLLHLNNTQMLKTVAFSHEEKQILNSFNFLTFKSVIYVANINNNNIYNNNVEQVKKIAISEGSKFLSVCAISSSYRLDDKLSKHDDLNCYRNDSINRLISYSYESLDLQTFFTINSKEVKAWSICTGSTVLCAARKIHTDFMIKFIKAQVIHFIDFIQYGGEYGVKQAGKIFLCGKDYILKDGDIIKIYHNTLFIVFFFMKYTSFFA